MSVWRITGFQPFGAPHWSVALIEAESPEAARGRLLATLSQPEPPDTVWGWGDTTGMDYRDPANWRIVAWDGLFILGGGCR